MFYVLRLVYAGQEAPVFQTRFPFYAETGFCWPLFTEADGFPGADGLLLVGCRFPSAAFPCVSGLVEECAFWAC